MSIWCTRTVLLFAIVDFGYPALNYLSAPVVMAATEGINLWTPSSASITRVQMATYPLAMLVVTTYGLFVRRFAIFGLGLLCIVSSMALCGYMTGIWMEGATARTSLFLQQQMIVTSIYLLAFAMEWQRSRLAVSGHRAESRPG